MVGLSGALCLALACGRTPTSDEPKVDRTGEQHDKRPKKRVVDTKPDLTFHHRSEQFADIQILRYQVPGFERLALKQKRVLYYLYEAALSGRDIAYDQNYRHNLTIRNILEAIWRSSTKARASPEYPHFVTYIKQVWFAQGIHHNHLGTKFKPQFSKDFFRAAVLDSDPSLLPLRKGERPAQLVDRLAPIIFDPTIDPKHVNREIGVDKVKTSAVNFYEGVSEQEVLAFYAQRGKGDGASPVSHGLNSKLVKENGNLVEKTWKSDGMYGPAVREIIRWLRKASAVAETPEQNTAINLLIQFYQTGDLKTFDDYSIAWVRDTASITDFSNGFLEVYHDPLSLRGTYESLVWFEDEDASRRIATIGSHAQWFEDNSPIEHAHKKPDVVGISAKVITVVVEAGDSAPTTPIGFNLPNANWIRQTHGSKSATLGNIVAALGASNKDSGVLEAFAASPDEVARAKAHGALAAKLEVDMHEVIGHASGRLLPGVKTTTETLKSYASVLEEARSDLVALYYMMDPKLIELGLMDSFEVGKASYDAFIRTSLLEQLAQLQPGQNIESAHMRNRQLIAAWAYELGRVDNVIERVRRDGKTYFLINDYERLRELFGQLLRELQRIKSTGDYEACKHLVETYAVKVDPTLHAEVLARYQKLGVAPYSGFIQPRLVPVLSGDEITDVRIEYPTDFASQQLEYSQRYAFLPYEN